MLEQKLKWFQMPTFTKRLVNMNVEIYAWVSFMFGYLLLVFQIPS